MTIATTEKISFQCPIVFIQSISVFEEDDCLELILNTFSFFICRPIN